MDVSTLKLPESSGRQLIIIAGVGGDLSLEMVQAITRTHPERELEFMLCPVRQHYLLRQGLIALGYGLVDESLLRENKRFYEIIHVSSGSDRAISPIGDRMWDLSRVVGIVNISTVPSPITSGWAEMQVRRLSRSLCIIGQLLAL